MGNPAGNIPRQPTPPPPIFSFKDIQIDQARGRIQVGNRAYEIVVLDPQSNRIAAPLTLQELTQIANLAKEIFQHQNFTFSDLDGVIISNHQIHQRGRPHATQPLTSANFPLYQQMREIIIQRSNQPVADTLLLDQEITLDPSIENRSALSFPLEQSIEEKPENPHQNIHIVASKQPPPSDPKKIIFREIKDKE